VSESPEEQQRRADEFLALAAPERPTFTHRQSLAVQLSVAATHSAQGRGIQLAEAFIDLLAGLVSQSRVTTPAQGIVWMQLHSAPPMFWNILVLIQQAGYSAATVFQRRLFEQYLFAAGAHRCPWPETQTRLADAAEARLKFVPLINAVSPPANDFYSYLSKLAHVPGAEYAERVLAAPQGLVAQQQAYVKALCEREMNLLFIHLLLFLQLAVESLEPGSSAEAVAWRQRFDEAQPIVKRLVESLPRKMVLKGLRKLPPFGSWPDRPPSEA